MSVKVPETLIGRQLASLAGNLKSNALQECHFHGPETMGSHGRTSAKALIQGERPPQTNKTNKQTNKQINKQANNQPTNQPTKQTSKQTSKQANKQKNKQTQTNTNTQSHIWSFPKSGKHPAGLWLLCHPKSKGPVLPNPFLDNKSYTNVFSVYDV